MVNTDARDDIFSLIEVHRGKLEAPLRLPPTDYEVPLSAPRPPKADKTRRDKQGDSKPGRANRRD